MTEHARIDSALLYPREPDIGHALAGIFLEYFPLHLAAVTLKRFVDDLSGIPFRIFVEQFGSGLLVYNRCKASPGRVKFHPVECVLNHRRLTGHVL